jgi:hypothetical protein
MVDLAAADPEVAQLQVAHAAQLVGGAAGRRPPLGERVVEPHQELRKRLQQQWWKGGPQPGDGVRIGGHACMVAATLPSEKLRFLRTMIRIADA